MSDQPDLPDLPPSLPSPVDGDDNWLDMPETEDSLPSWLLDEETDDGMAMSSDQMPTRNPGSSRKKLKGPCSSTRYPGPSRMEIITSCEMVPVRVQYLWDVKVPRHLHGTIQDDVVEVYSPPRVLEHATRLGLRGNLSADLETGWDLTKVQDRTSLMIQIKARRPKTLILSPPCTWFSTLMQLNWAKIPQEKRETLLREAILHLEFSLLLADYQQSCGRKFVLEHPDKALSWNSSKIKYLTDKDQCICQARFDMCCFGLRSKVDLSPHRKPTRILTNMALLWEKLNNCRCTVGHKHTPIQGSEGGMRRSRWAQVYPDAFCALLAQAACEHMHGSQ